VIKQTSNYCGIPLLPTTYKILSDILLSRLTPYAEEIIGDIDQMSNKNQFVKIKKEKEIHASITCAPITTQVMSMVHEKCLGKTEKALNLLLEDMNRKSVLVDSNVFCQKALIVF
jgi:hypothetical protein